MKLTATTTMPAPRQTGAGLDQWDGAAEVCGDASPACERPRPWVGYAQHSSTQAMRKEIQREGGGGMQLLAAHFALPSFGAPHNGRNGGDFTLGPTGALAGWVRRVLPLALEAEPVCILPGPQRDRRSCRSVGSDCPCCQQVLELRSPCSRDYSRKPDSRIRSKAQTHTGTSAV